MKTATTEAKPSSAEIYAVKRIKPEHIHNHRGGFPHYLLREINVLLGCSHTNLVRVVEVCTGDDPSEVFLVMEYCPADVKVWMRELRSEPRLTLAQVKNLTQQLLHGLAHLHHNWVVHRDIKTSNLLLDAHGGLKICDFGLVRHFGGVALPPEAWTAHVMTMIYRSPEVVFRARHLYSAALDLWGVGVVFAELLLGSTLVGRCARPPFVPDSVEAETELIRELFELLGVPCCLDLYKGTKMGKAILSQLPCANPTENTVAARFGSRLSPLGVDFLLLLLHWDPRQRPSAKEALEHPFFSEEPMGCANAELPPVTDINAITRRRVGRSGSPKGNIDVRNTESMETGLSAPQEGSRKVVYSDGNNMKDIIIEELN